MTSLPVMLTVSALLFAVGLFAVLTRRNAILVLVGIELMLNAANLNFIAFWAFDSPLAHQPAEPALTGPMFVLFSIAIAAAEAAVGLAIILMVFRHTRSTDLNRLDSLHG
jgi:NADH:ubiquinone oxidoreductase subunit K